jgi:hypothetical protein
MENSASPQPIRERVRTEQALGALAEDVLGQPPVAAIHGLNTTTHTWEIRGEVATLASHLAPVPCHSLGTNLSNV